VLLVHGLWMHGAVFHLLRRRLVRRGFSVRTFSYPSVRNSLAANTSLLEAFVDGLASERIHLVGHSLGGVLILNLLARQRVSRIGRVVLMGAPCCGSHCARLLAGLPGLAGIVGHSVRDWLAAPRPILPTGLEIGVLSGNRGIGMGRLLPGLPAPNDGIVAVSETRLEQATDSLTLHVGHSEMLFSAACADQVEAFLTSGRFRAAPTAGSKDPRSTEKGP